MAVRHTGECLPTDDAVEDQEALHGEHCEGAGDDRAIVSEDWWLSVCRLAMHAAQRGMVTYPQEYRARTMERMPSLGPKTALSRVNTV